MFGEQRREPGVAEEPAVAARLEQSVGGGEERVAGGEGDRALGVAAVLLDAERDAGGGEFLLVGAGAEDSRWRVARVAVAQCTVVRDGEEGGGEARGGSRRCRIRFVCASTSAVIVGVPGAGLA